MRKIFLFILLVGVAIVPASAQTSRKAIKTSTKVSKAPEAVSQAFQQTFANASQVSWHKMASGHWFADFSQDSLETKAEYTNDGQWVATRTSFSQSALPDTLLNAMKLKYPGATINQVLRIQRADVPAYYQITLDENGIEKDILANDSGSITE